MPHSARFGFVNLAGTLALVLVATLPCAAVAADINSVTGPLPGEFPTATQCAAPAAAPAIIVAPGHATRRLNDAATPSSRPTIDGTARVTQTWTNCTGAVLPRSISASIEVGLPGKAGLPGAQGSNVKWGSGASAAPAAPSL